MSSYGNTSMKEVARVAGVSLSTVSRAIHKKGDISKDAQSRIDGVMKQLGYRPNLLVKALRTGKSQAIGVITSCDLTFDGVIIRGIHDKLQEVDCVPVLQLIEPEGPPELELLNRLLDRRVDGVIMKMFSNMGLEMYVNELRRRKVPVIAVDVTLDNIEVDFVGNDDKLGGRLAAEHLLEFGHRRLGALCFQRTFLPSLLRIEAFESVVRRFADASVSSFEDPSFGSDDSMAMKLLTMQPRPTAIFVNNDKLALGVYSAAEKLGLNIPEDLSVIGFGDLSLCTLVKPGLTTIQQNPYEIGLKSAEMMIERLENNDLSNSKRYMVDVHLIERGSVVKPKPY